MGRANELLNYSWFKRRIDSGVLEGGSRWITQATEFSCETHRDERVRAWMEDWEYDGEKTTKRGKCE